MGYLDLKGPAHARKMALAWSVVAMRQNEVSNLTAVLAGIFYEELQSQ